MCSKKTDVQQWSIKTEFTFGPERNPSTSNTLNKNGIHFLCCLRTNENVGLTKISGLNRNNLYRPVEYQKGNLTFTSIPPHRLENTTSRCNFEVHDSGYGSDLLPLNSTVGQLSPNINNMSNRKCRSTCNIILHSDFCNKEEQTLTDYTKCGIHKSGQMPNNQRIMGNGNCDGGHKNLTEDNKLQQNSLCHKTYKKDVSVQTSDSLQKCSLISSDLEHLKKNKSKRLDKANIKNCIDTSSTSACSMKGSSDMLQTCTNKGSKKEREQTSTTKKLLKNPHTIHIDVYCTDTDMELSDSTLENSSENESIFAPPKVQQSKQIYITHKRATNYSLPFKLKKNNERKIGINKIIEKYDSDSEEESTTSYPSRMDSCSVINDTSSSLSSVNSSNSYSFNSSTSNNFNYKYNSLKNVNTLEDLYILSTQKNKLKAKNIYKIDADVLGKQTDEAGDLIQFCKKYVQKNSDTNVESCDTKEKKDNRKHIKDSINRRKETSNTLLTVLPGQCTEQIASRYGQVVNMFKKPGHHNGPTKNPHCSCDHCRRYFTK